MVQEQEIEENQMRQRCTHALEYVQIFLGEEVVDIINPYWKK